MRQRHSTGGVRKQRGRWIGLWYENGVKKSRVIGHIKDMTKGEAREAVSKIISEERAKHETTAALKSSGATNCRTCSMRRHMPGFPSPWSIIFGGT